MGSGASSVGKPDRSGDRNFEDVHSSVFWRLTALVREDLDFDTLSELQRRGFAEHDLDRENAGVDRAPGIFGTNATGNDRVGDLFNLSLPGRARVALGRDQNVRPERNATRVELVDLG